MARTFRARDALLLVISFALGLVCIRLGVWQLGRSEGPHLSFAIPWFSFGGIAIVGGAARYRHRRSARATRQGGRS